MGIGNAIRGGGTYMPNQDNINNSFRMINIKWNIKTISNLYTVGGLKK